MATGCDKLSSISFQQVQARTAEDSIEAFLTYQEALIGKDSDAVVEVFGKPKGIFERHTGKVWMYSRWCVEFDPQGRVRKMERDIAASGSGGSSNGTSMALAAPPVAPSPTAASPKRITKVSNGGQPVDLNGLLPAGKISVVDFYADWCGPCQQISPHLEKLVSQNPDLVLVKVDIATWGTPVTEQYDINSVPNIRVFDRNRKPVGKPTSSLSAVQSYISKAGG